MQHEPDGTLHSWEDIAERERWDVLLLGNGLSINVWDGFAYTHLFDHGGGAHLTKRDRAMFQGHVNFERVLAELNTAIRMNELAGLDATPLYERYRHIQRALGHAVREVHPDQQDIPASTFATIRSTLTEFERVFTTSYDLLLYWAIRHGGSYKPFKDYFAFNGRCQFDAARVGEGQKDLPIYYLHGALHLVVGEAGATWKLSYTSLKRILDQFGEPTEGDPQARPLLVTEGSAPEKREAIESNEYLRHALGRLKEWVLPTVVFGSRLGEEDDHLVEALGGTKRAIAISMLPGRPKPDRLRLQGDLWQRLRVKDLYFFDATTHPLGSADLRAQSQIYSHGVRP